MSRTHILPFFLLAALAAAQSDAVVCRPPVISRLAPERAEQPAPGQLPAIPQPPNVVQGSYNHVSHVVPVGADRGRPQPSTPEARLVEEGRAAPLAGQFRYFRNTACRPANTSVRAAIEPSAAVNRDTVLVTGNWFAGLSQDGGQTFTDLNPFTMFPTLDGGFCCDQRTEHIASHDMTVWYQQYAYSATTGRGSIRVAVARGRDRLRSGVASDWVRYVFDPQTLGYPTNCQFDFPDVSYTDDYFYWTSNVAQVDAFGNLTIFAAVCVRMDLNDMQAGGTVTYSSFRSDLAGNGGGFSWRLANGGNGAPMFWADTTSTTNIRIWRWQVGGSVDYVDRAVASFSSATATATGADGRAWMGNATGRIRGAWGQAGEIGFLWTSATQANRPNPYVRVARFTTPARDLIDEHDIWSNTLAIGYGAAEANSLGDVGIVVALCSTSTFPRSGATIVDSYQPWGTGLTFTIMATGSAGPTTNRWGDYFDVQRHWLDQRTFLGTGQLMTGSNASTSRVAWFGRDDYEPAWVTLDVSSTGATAVPITLDVTDRNGLADGTTPFTRSFAPRQGYELTAPLTHLSGGRLWSFERWAYTLSSGAIVRLHDLGDPVLAIDDMGTSSDTAEARYLAVRDIAIESFNPASGVAITIDVADVNGARNGTTPFVRSYPDGTVVQLTAPDLGPSQPFRRWQRGNTFNTNRSVNIVVGADETLVAQYWTYTRGSSVVRGTGCPGRDNVVPGHRVLGTPEIGQTLSYEVRHGPSANLVTVLHLGSLSNPPIPLAAIGMGTCVLMVNPIALNLAAALDGSGQLSLPINVPDDIGLIGASLTSQAAVFDPGTATPVKWVESNGVDVTLGGLGY
ncbi:MAG: hypothetical protein R3F56_25335 [Planctomycetota bacterium]